MKSLAFLILVLFLTACAPAVPQTQTSEAFAGYPAGTETLVILPTTTPIPEPTPTPLPPELSGLPGDSYTLDADGLHVTLPDGQTMDIPTSEIAERVKPGAAGTTLILGDPIPDAKETDSRRVAALFDGNEWSVPEGSRNLRFTPSLMEIKGEPVPAVIEVVGEEGSMNPRGVSTSLREINITQPSDFQSDAGDYQRLRLFHLTLNHKTIEKITVYPGKTGKEETMYQARLTFAYMANGRVGQVQFLIKNQTSEFDEKKIRLTENYMKEQYKIGSRFDVSFRYFLDTPAFNPTKARSNEQKWCDVRGIGCYFNSSEQTGNFYTYEEIKNLLFNSSGIVVLEEGVVIGDINSDSTP